MPAIWDSRGLIPPISPDSPAGPIRSPYLMTIEEFVRTFGFSLERCELLTGLLAYRKMVYGAGIVDGFQWLNGSFVTCTEMRQKRPPNDIDCVTFFKIPGGYSQKEFVEQHLALFDNLAIKQQYKVDSYWVGIESGQEVDLIRSVCYWYGLWSHNTDYVWKGFIEVPLNPVDDEAVPLPVSLTPEAGNGD